jgi:hypothetical protein
MILYIIGLILCYTYHLPVAVTVLCWIGAVCSFLKGVIQVAKAIDD